MNEEGNGEDNQKGRKDSFENLFIKPSVDLDIKMFVLLDRHYKMIAPEDEELTVRNGSNHHKDQHVDEPVKAKVEHDLGMIEGSKIDDKIVREVSFALSVKSIVHLACDNPAF